MGFCQPVNLRDYVSHNPPGVTFFLCLFTLSISFICLSFYNYNHTLPNPDTLKDWNKLLSSFSQFYLCEKVNASSFLEMSSVPPPPMNQEKEEKTSVSSTTSPPVTFLHLRVPVAVTTVSPSHSLKGFGLRTTLTASQLHLGDKENMNLTIATISGNTTCLTISAPTYLLPMTLLPPKCPITETNISTIHVEVSNQLPTSLQTCYRLHFENDPKLRVMLTKEEQSVAVRHLLEVSFCILGVCVLFLAAVTLTNSFTRRHHWNGLDLQKEPLIES
ncbi:transmembrane protein 248 [Cololabis saira]|uniref:transmembrane protein 248 n=1 Tax=Cololabis saira TaxID=129043 RepID=UPI002AD3BB98|nr:transmembrane protein 248 [Cololabis saira]XP_061585961.1 transmembrane protein 248 [Cololabis saira]